MSTSLRSIRTSPPAVNVPTSRSTLTDVLLIAIAAAYSPALVMTRNLEGIGHPERLIWLFLGVFTLGLLSVSIGLKLGMRHSASVLFSLVVILCLSRGAVFLQGLGTWGGLLAFASVLALAGFVLRRFEDDRLIRIIVVSLAVFLASGPVLQVMKSVTTLGDDVTSAAAPVDVGLESTPDIVLVLVDGYSGLVSYPKNIGVEPGWPSDLADAGFQIPTSAWSSYPTTAAAVPSLLDMSYVLGEGPGIDEATSRHLHRIIGGEGSLYAVLKANGYSLTLIESGWSGSSCGPLIDECETSAFLDEATFLVLEPSLIGPAIVSSNGSPFTVGARRTMSWLRTDMSGLFEDDRPDFVFAHVTAPHAPFFLDEDCQVDYRPEYASFGRDLAESSVGISGYARQAACVGDLLGDLADSIPPATTIVFVADHGTDTRNQLAVLPEDWGFDAIEERLNVLMAVRSPDCEIGDGIMLPNVFRRVLSCLGADDLPDLEPRMFLYSAVTVNGEPVPIVEVEDETVRLLVGDD